MFTKDFWKLLTVSVISFLLVFGGAVYNFDRQMEAQAAKGMSKVRTYVIGIDPVAERVSHSQTGVTMGHAGGSAGTGTGVSVWAIIDLWDYNLVDYEFAIQPGTMWTQGDSEDQDVTSGTSIFRIGYLLSADNKGVTDFETALTTGITEVGAGWQPDSKSTAYPVNISSPELGRYLVIFGMPLSTGGTSQFKVPPYKADGTISGNSLYVIAR